MDELSKSILNKYRIKMEHPDMGCVSLWVIQDKNVLRNQWRVKLPDDLMATIRKLQEEE